MIPFNKNEKSDVWNLVEERDGGTVTFTTYTFEVFDMDDVSVQASATASLSGDGTATAYIYGLVDTTDSGFVEGSQYQVKFLYNIGSEDIIDIILIQIIEDDIGVIVPYPDVMVFTGQQDSANLWMAYLAMQKAVINAIRWDPTEITHTNKLYDGEGSNYLYLQEMKITGLIRVANTREDVIRIRNTTTTISNAYYKVVYASSAPASMTLVAGSSSSSLAFSTYTTMTSLVDAINALGSGWEAEMIDSNYDDYPTTNLVEAYNYFVGAWRGTESSWEYVEMADEPISGVRLYADEGYIFSSSGFPYGHRNIAVSYVSGYSQNAMPDDLKMAVLKLVKILDSQRSEDRFNIQSFSLGHLSVTYGDVTEAIPDDIRQTLDFYTLVNAR